MNLMKATNGTMTLANRAVMGCALISPVVALNTSWLYWMGALLVWQFYNIVGISAGAHRYFSHAAFECSRFWQWLMAYTCMVSLVGPPCIWAEAHVRHHRHADRDGDPYQRFALGNDSALDHTTKVSGAFLKQAARESLHRLTLKYYWAFLMVHGAAVAALAWLLGAEVGQSLFWFMLVPAGLSQLTLRFILWTGHVGRLGYRNHETPDTSNNWWFASLIAAGEGWHNNHHAYPGHAKLGEHWWEFDPGWWFIKAISK